ncbi:aminoacyl-tRNA deacylase [Allofustis seminis]|uniref:aminoacyl-tRNA deacylase n=1 Tax=Allofustis seminis TaxID=166939 RepID=UPI00036E8BA4|nr:aminoacyl-tRNA deacylase [Allofustis seminis]
MSKNEKTNVMRLIEQHRLPYKPHYKPLENMAAQGILSQSQIFKTLVTVGKSNAHYVFMIPTTEELDLKKAAAACGEKNIHMIKERDLLPLTGYVHGGCSPIGMKVDLPTYIDESAQLFSTFLFSAGKVNYSVELSLEHLQAILPITVADLTVVE